MKNLLSQALSHNLVLTRDHLVQQMLSKQVSVLTFGHFDALKQSQCTESQRNNYIISSNAFIDAGQGNMP